MPLINRNRVLTRRIMNQGQGMATWKTGFGERFVTRAVDSRLVTITQRLPNRRDVPVLVHSRLPQAHVRALGMNCFGRVAAILNMEQRVGIGRRRINGTVSRLATEGLDSAKETDTSGRDSGLLISSRNGIDY